MMIQGNRILLIPRSGRAAGPLPWAKTRPSETAATRRNRECGCPEWRSALGLLRLPQAFAAATLSRMLQKVPLVLLIASAFSLVGGCAHHKPHRRTDDATLTLADLPPNVDKSFHRDHGTATIKQIDKQTDNQPNRQLVRYKITYYDTDGTRHQVSYDPEGDTLDSVNSSDGSASH